MTRENSMLFSNLHSLARWIKNGRFLRDLLTSSEDVDCERQNVSKPYTRVKTPTTLF